MSYSLTQISGKKIGATDLAIERVEHSYFDDQAIGDMIVNVDLQINELLVKASNFYPAWRHDFSADIDRIKAKDFGYLTTGAIRLLIRSSNSVGNA